jgi:hypothetical protein
MHTHTHTHTHTYTHTHTHTHAHTHTHTHTCTHTHTHTHTQRVRADAPAQVSCLNKVLEAPELLTTKEQEIVRAILDPVDGLGSALDPPRRS